VPEFPSSNLLINHIWVFDQNGKQIIHNPLKPKEYDEYIFKGLVQMQLTSALNVIKEKVIRQKVVKLDGQAESLRIANFPFTAIEESLANSVFHKDYSLHKPVEVQVLPNREITILSFPGPVPPIDNSDLQKERIIAHDYRNRRLGDFLKELHHTEGRATGVPLIHKSLKANGSPDAVLFTDEQGTLFLVTISVHKAFEDEAFVLPVNEPSLTNWEDLVEYFIMIIGLVNSKSGAQVTVPVSAQDIYQVNVPVGVQVGAQVSSILSAGGINVEKARKALESVELHPLNREAILLRLGLSNHFKNYTNYISPLIEKGLLAYTSPGNLKSPNQQYKITLHGLLLLKILKQG